MSTPTQFAGAAAMLLSTVAFMIAAFIVLFAAIWLGTPALVVAIGLAAVSCLCGYRFLQAP